MSAVIPLDRMLVNHTSQANFPEQSCLVLSFITHFIITLGKFRPPYLGNATAAPRAALPSPTSEVHAGSFCVSVIHQALTWTTGYLMYVRDYSYAVMRTSTHRLTEVGHTDNKSAQHFWLGKTLKNFGVPLMGFEPQVFGSWVWFSINWATPSANKIIDSQPNCGTRDWHWQQKTELIFFLKPNVLMVTALAPLVSKSVVRTLMLSPLFVPNPYCINCLTGELWCLEEGKWSSDDPVHT